MYINKTVIYITNLSNSLCGYLTVLTVYNIYILEFRVIGVGREERKKSIGKKRIKLV